MPQNKRQHYVPRFYLKRFSPDVKSINIWNLRSKQKIISASLRDQCYKDYFYSKQLDIEKGLSLNEGHMATILEIIDKRCVIPPPRSPEHLAIILYVIMQHGRTKYAADQVDEMNDQVFKHVHRQPLKLKGIDIDQFDTSINDAPLITLGILVQCYPLLLDLAYKLLLNKTDVDFITSDNPVVLYNQLFSFRKFGSNTGMVQKGLQIFLPISPKSALVFYDHNVYTVGKRRGLTVDIDLAKDVYELNTLQMCSALNCVYFQDRELDVNSLYRKSSPFLRQKKGNLIPGEKINDGRGGFVGISREDVRTNLALSFLRIKNGAKLWKKKFQKLKSQPVYVLRNQELYDLHEEFMSKVENKEYELGNFFQYLKDKNQSVP